MERKNTKVRVFLLKILRILLTPISRLRKLLRKSNLRIMKISLGIMVIISCIVTVTYLYHLSFTVMSRTNEKTTQKSQIGTPMRHVPLDEVYKDLRKTGNKDYIIDDDQAEPAPMVDTPGCKIPVAMLDYEKYINKNKNIKFMCGKRAVFLRKVASDKVIARIQSRVLDKYNKNYTQIDCCYQFIIDSIQYPHEKPKLIFSNCTKLQHETIITLQSDFINVICKGYDVTKNISFKIYDDMYAFSKRSNISQLPENKSCKTRYNVLMLGMDSMSLPRAVKTLPRTITFLKNDNWLGFRGYHKVADHTLPNLIAALTGFEMSAISKQCSGAMDNCNDLFIWNAFKEAGYVTVYGEDNLQFPDTFTKDYAFRNPPTDHYMRTFFRKEEGRENDLLCAGKASSGQQVLDYALDFVNTYKKDSFFGFFWINSFSSGLKSHPEDADKILENFLNQLSYTGILKNTFVILFSDHGIRFGELRLKMEGYYDDRMPMNFMWIPFIFKGMQPYEVRALAINQRRLVTPYDIYSTLLDIKRVSLCINSSDSKPKGCRNCHSMFEVVNSNRTCQDAAINDKWCSCHKLYPLPIQDSIGIKGVNVVVNHINNKVNMIATQRCWGCRKLSLQRIIRIHFYYGRNKISLFYVVAFTMAPGNLTYEATVLRKGADHAYAIIGPVSLISNYRGLGNCVPDHKDRLFCVCEKVQKCDIEA